MCAYIYIFIFIYLFFLQPQSYVTLNVSHSRTELIKESWHSCLAGSSASFLSRKASACKEESIPGLEVGESQDLGSLL